MQIRSLLFLWMLLTPLVGFSLEKTSYFSTEAMPGDGIYSILRRYDLGEYSCNFEKFYRLNKLKKNAPLKVGKTYKLPILIYAFNGKTIRSSIGHNDWDMAVRIQEYNEKMFELGLRENPFREDKVLWVPYHELNCPGKDLNIPSPVSENPEIAQAIKTTGKRKFPIFGPDYAHTPLQSNKLRGEVYYVVAGHGGPDPGALGKRNNKTLCEDEYAYDVALRLCRHLIAHGATAYMINRDDDDGIRDDTFLDCDTDEVLWGDIKMVRWQKARLTQRSEIINDLYKKHRLQGVSKQQMIIIHIDSRNKSERTDLFFYYRDDDAASKTLASNLQKTMRAKYKKYQANRQYFGTVSARDLHMLRETKPTAVYIELGNIRNNADQQRIILKNNRQLLADWLFEGLQK
jgi:N-acetylmuramoyl-L-alanine amidase